MMDKILVKTAYPILEGVSGEENETRRNRRATLFRNYFSNAIDD